LFSDLIAIVQSEIDRPETYENHFPSTDNLNAATPDLICMEEVNGQGIMLGKDYLRPTQMVEMPEN
jgi:hypothetical protein